MPTVYVAHDLKYDPQVALKVMRPGLSAVLGMCTEDAVSLAQDSPVVEGWAAIRAGFEAVGTFQDFTVTSLEVDGYGDLAYV